MQLVVTRLVAGVWWKDVWNEGEEGQKPYLPDSTWKPLTSVYQTSTTGLKARGQRPTVLTSNGPDKGNRGAVMRNLFDYTRSSYRFAYESWRGSSKKESSHGLAEPKYSCPTGSSIPEVVDRCSPCKVAEGILVSPDMLPCNNCLIPCPMQQQHTPSVCFNMHSS